MRPLTPTAAADLARAAAPCGPVAPIDPATLVADLRAAGELSEGCVRQATGLRPDPRISDEIAAAYAAERGGAMTADRRTAAEAHAAACRDAIRAGKPGPCWEGGSLRGADLSDADLAGGNFRGGNFRGANLGCADLRDSDLRGAIMRTADLTSADLRRADLNGADLGDADLSNADLIGTNLRDADLIGTNLRDADLNGADLSGAIVPEGAIAAVIVGKAGGYRWHAFALDTGGCILRYGCDRATLSQWQARGPEYGNRHNHGPEHWAIGPAVAISAAEAMMAERGGR